MCITYSILVLERKYTRSLPNSYGVHKLKHKGIKDLWGTDLMFIIFQKAVLVLLINLKLTQYYCTLHLSVSYFSSTANRSTKYKRFCDFSILYMPATSSDISLESLPLNKIYSNLVKITIKIPSSLIFL